MGVFDRAARFAAHADPQGVIARVVRLAAVEEDASDDEPIYRQ